ncbi:MAG: 50S ribosomal protein L3 [Enterobacteriaceae bacterium]
MIDRIVGKKIGMTRIFDENFVSVPITIILVKKNYIVQIKNVIKDGYNALQVTTGFNKKYFFKNKSFIGHFNKSNLKVGLGLWELRYDGNNKYKVGDYIDISIFSNIKKVDVTGISKGKGFSGTVKRWNFSTQDSSHGNSLSHRKPGSIGQNQSPGRVFKGKKMAGHLGNERITVQNLSIIEINYKNSLLLLKGSVPGNVNKFLIIKNSKKNKKYENKSFRYK